LLLAIYSLGLAVPFLLTSLGVDRIVFSEIARYSGTSFILIIAYKLRFKTDEIVISTMLSVAAVTYFSIGDRLLDYTGEVVSSLAQIFVPMSSQSDAKGDKERLRKILIAGNRACALIVFPITATLIILGKSVITAWVGKTYVQASYPVMLALLIPSTFSLAQAASPRILYGMAKHRSLALVTGMEAIANLILSVVLIRPFGIFGDALGTAIPLTCTALFFMPRHLCRILNVPIGFFLRQAYTLPILLCAPTVAVLLLMQRWFFARTYLQVGLQVLIGLVPYGLGLAWAISSGRIWSVVGFSVRNELELVEAISFETPSEKP
jgi:O-antigen/teichoic acid export membrane protein